MLRLTLITTAVTALLTTTGCGGDADVATEFKWRREAMDDLRLTFRYPEENPPPKAKKLKGLFALIERAPKVKVEKRSLNGWRMAWQDEFAPILAKKLDELNSAVQRQEWEAEAVDVLVRAVGNERTKERWTKLHAAAKEFIGANSMALEITYTGPAEQLDRKARAAIHAGLRHALTTKATPTGSVAPASSQSEAAAGVVRVRVEPVLESVTKPLQTSEMGNQNSTLTVSVSYARVTGVRIVITAEPTNPAWSWKGTLHDEIHALPAVGADPSLEDIFATIREGESKESAMQREMNGRAERHALERLRSWLDTFAVTLPGTLPALESR